MDADITSSGDRKSIRLTIREDARVFTDSAIGSFWDSAIEATGALSTFRSREWLTCWWDHFGGERQLRMIVAHAGDRLVGLLPLFEQEQRIAPGLRWTRWQLLGTGIAGSDYLGVISMPADARAVADAMADGLPSWPADVVDLQDLESNDALMKIATRAHVTVADRFICPFVPTTGDFGAYLHARPNGLGAQFRRRRRWLEREAGACLEEIGPTSTDAAVEEALAELFRLHEARWRRRGGSDGIDGPRTRSFHRGVARAFQRRGWLRLFILRAAGRAAAVLYGFERHGVLQFYQAGFDPAWSSRSAGTVLLGSILRRCFDGNVAEFDFLRGAEAYKLLWATDVRRTRALRAVAPRSRARLLAGMDDVRTRLSRRLGKTLPAARSIWRQWELRTRRLSGGGY